MSVQTRFRAKLKAQRRYELHPNFEANVPEKQEIEVPLPCTAQQRVAILRGAASAKASARSGITTCFYKGHRDGRDR